MAAAACAWTLAGRADAAASAPVPPARPADRGPPVGFLSLGYLYADVRGDAPARAHGFELSGHVFHPSLPVGLGAFAQAQIYAGDHARFAGGAQLTFACVGLELGYAHREAGAGPPVQRSLVTGDVTSHRSQSSGLHLAPFLSFGFVYFAYRWTIPLATGPAPTHGAEHALTVGVKLPLQLTGKSWWRAVPDALSAFH